MLLPVTRTRFLLLLLCAPTLLGSAACTRDIWTDAGGTRANITHKVYATPDRLAIVYGASDGLPPREAYLTLALGGDGEPSDLPSTGLGGRTLEELRSVRMSDAILLAPRGRSDELPRRRHLASKLPAGPQPFQEIDAIEITRGDGRVLLAYWPLGQHYESEFVKVSLPRNDGKGTYTTYRDRAIVPVVVVLPERMPRAPAVRVASVAGAVALTPVALVTDVVLYGTSPLWVPLALPFADAYMRP